MFAHVLALCYTLRLLKRSNHYALKFIFYFVIFVILLFNKLKGLELIEISTLLLFKCFDFASGEIMIIWRADIKRVNVLFCLFKVIQS